MQEIIDWEYKGAFVMTAKNTTPLPRRYENILKKFVIKQ